MGKGDQKTRRGKIVRGTYGKSRSRKKDTNQAQPASAGKAAARTATKKK